MSNRKIPLTLSSWTIGDKVKFEDRVIFAKKAGYDGIGLRYENYADAKKLEGLTDEDMLAILKKHDYKVTEVEYITQWAHEQDRTEFQREKEQGTYHMAKLFGVKHINCGLLEHYDLEHYCKGFKALCERAGDLIIGLEFMPYSGVNNLDIAKKIIEYVDRPNAMLILDSWHWMRANEPFDRAKDIPADKVISVQLNDVREERYPEEILRDESMHARVNPGKGYGDTAAFVRMLKEAGVNPTVIGAEVISDANLEKGEEVAAKETFEDLYKVLEENWPEVLK